MKGIKKPTNYRWLVFALLMGLYVIGLFLRLCLGVVKGDLETFFVLSPAAFGALGGAYFYAYLLMQIPTGMLADSWGPKKTAMLGNFILLLGTVVFAAAPNLPLLFAGRILCGLGSAMVFIPVTKIVAYWFTEQEFGAINGLISCLGYLGGLVAQAPLAWLITKMSWRMVFLILGGMVALVWLANLKWTYVRPEDAGMPSIPGSDSKAGGTPLTQKEMWRGLRIVLSRKRSWPPALIALGFFGSFNALTGVWGTAFVSAAYGKTGLEASGAIQYALIGMALGSITIAGISGKIGRRRGPLLISGGVLSLCWLIMAANTGGIIPYPVFCGLLLLLGYCTSAVVLTMISIKEMHLVAYAGMAVAVYNVGCFLGAALAAPVMGGLIGAVMKAAAAANEAGAGVVIAGAGAVVAGAAAYRLAFGFCLLLVLISWAAAGMMLETGCRNRGQELEEKAAGGA